MVELQSKARCLPLLIEEEEEEEGDASVDTSTALAPPRFVECGTPLLTSAPLLPTASLLPDAPLLDWQRGG